MGHSKNKRIVLFGICVIALLMAPSVFGSELTCEDGTVVDPFAHNNGMIPPPDEYDGPFFQMSFDYPDKHPRRGQTYGNSNPRYRGNSILNWRKSLRGIDEKKQVHRHKGVRGGGPFPWTAVLGGKPISKKTAPAYAEALKNYVSEDMRVLIYDYPNWDAAKAGWYNSPWIFPVREAIHGAYLGSTFVPDTFPKSGLKTTMSTYVLTYFDEVAALQLREVWGSSAAQPQIAAAGGQFPEGSVIVKAAFTTANGEEWPPMKGAFPWQMYIPPETDNGPSGDAVVQDVQFFQFDIIVKDSYAAPRTGWVFMTLVYDKSFPHRDNWDQMIPLGVMWGNDPEVVSPIEPPYPELGETWINPQAPTYSTETLGWGGRLSGPNDGAVIQPAYLEGQGLVDRLPASSCMSCHLTAQYPFQSFLLPVPLENGEPRIKDNALYPYTPASANYMSYHQSNPGTSALDKSSFGLDYGMVLAFKATRYWGECVLPSEERNPVHLLIDNYRKHPFIPDSP